MKWRFIFVIRFQSNFTLRNTVLLFWQTLGTKMKVISSIWRQQDGNCLRHWKFGFTACFGGICNIKHFTVWGPSVINGDKDFCSPSLWKSLSFPSDHKESPRRWTGFSCSLHYKEFHSYSGLKHHLLPLLTDSSPEMPPLIYTLSSGTLSLSSAAVL